MANQSIHQSSIVRAAPEEVYDAWLDSKTHSRFAGNRSALSAQAGQPFHVGGDEIVGTLDELIANTLIVMSLRTQEFERRAPDSRVSVYLERLPEVGTRVSLEHHEVPENAAEWLRRHWSSFFSRMRAYFGAPKAAKLALATHGEEPRRTLDEHLKAKEHRKPSGDRTALVGEKAARAGRPVSKPERPSPATAAARRRSPETRAATVAETPVVSSGRTTQGAKAGRRAARASEPRRRAPSDTSAWMRGIGEGERPPRRSAEEIARASAPPRKVAARPTASMAARVARAPGGKATTRKPGRKQKKPPRKK